MIPKSSNLSIFWPRWLRCAKTWPQRYKRLHVSRCSLRFKSFKSKQLKISWRNTTLNFQKRSKNWLLNLIRSKVLKKLQICLPQMMKCMILMTNFRIRLSLITNRDCWIPYSKESTAQRTWWTKEQKSSQTLNLLKILRKTLEDRSSRPSSIRSQSQLPMFC